MTRSGPIQKSTVFSSLSPSLTALRGTSPALGQSHSDLSRGQAARRHSQRSHSELSRPDTRRCRSGERFVRLFCEEALQPDPGGVQHPLATPQTLCSAVLVVSLALSPPRSAEHPLSPANLQLRNPTSPSLFFAPTEPKSGRGASSLKGSSVWRIGHPTWGRKAEPYPVSQDGSEHPLCFFWRISRRSSFRSPPGRKPAELK